MSFLHEIGEVPTDEFLFGLAPENNERAEEKSLIKKVSRRNFMKTTGIAGSTLAIGLQFSCTPSSPKPSSARSLDANNSSSTPSTPDKPFDLEKKSLSKTKTVFNPDVFISIDDAGTVTIISHR